MKRRMPAHIVLPNGMWRFVKRGKGSSRRARVNTMSRRGRRTGRRRGSRGFGGGGLLMTGLKVLAGAGAGAWIANRFGVDPRLGGAIGGAVMMPGNLMKKAAGAGVGALTGVPVASAASNMLGQASGGAIRLY